MNQGLMWIAARVSVAWVFLFSAYQLILRFQLAQARLGAQGWILTEVAIVGSIVVMVLGSVSILLGFKASKGALLLLIYLVPLSLIFHNPFYGNPLKQLEFFKTLAVAGGLLMIVVHGSGPWSLKK
jgi:putative oxidoreductase